jgi:uncharacterized SAM-binding protein YcdF (DUF218 family)
MFLKKLLSSFILSPFIIIFLFIPFLFLADFKKSKKVKLYIFFVCFLIYFLSTDFGKNFIFYFLEKEYIDYNVKDIVLNSKIIKNDKLNLIVVLAAGGDYRYQLSEDSYDRLFVSYFLYKRYNCDIFLSGGAISNNINLKVPISNIMYFYLQNLGVPKEKIFIDDESLDTFQNINNLKKFISNKNYNNIIILTSSYHIPRTKLLFNNLMDNNKLNSKVIFLGCSFKYSKYYDIYSFIPSFYNLYLSFLGIKEYWGIIYYYFYFYRLKKLK